MKRWSIYAVTALLLYVILGLLVYPLENKMDAIYTMPPSGSSNDVKLYYWDKRRWYKNSVLNKNRISNKMIYRIFYPLVWARMQSVELKVVENPNGELDISVE